MKVIKDIIHFVILNLFCHFCIYEGVSPASQPGHSDFHWTDHTEHCVQHVPDGKLSDKVSRQE